MRHYSKFHSFTLDSLRVQSYSLRLGLARALVTDGSFWGVPILVQVGCVCVRAATIGTRAHVAYCLIQVCLNERKSMCVCPFKEKYNKHTYNDQTPFEIVLSDTDTGWIPPGYGCSYIKYCNSKASKYIL